MYLATLHSQEEEVHFSEEELQSIARYVPQLPLFEGDIVAPEKFPQLQIEIDLTTIF